MKRVGIYLGSMCLVLLAACGNAAEDEAQSKQPATRPAAEIRPTKVALPSRPDAIAQGREPYSFESLSEMVVSADLVVLGEVSGVVPGREVQGFKYRVFEVVPEQVMKGDLGDEPLLVEEVGWSGGVPWTFNDASWAQSGDRAVFALIRKPEAEQWRGHRLFQLASTQARFFLRPNGSVEDNYLPSAAQDAFVAAQEKKTQQEFLKDVRAETEGSAG